MRPIAVWLSLLALFGAGTATAADAPVQDLADGRPGTIYFESVTPIGFIQLAKRQAMQKTVIFGTLRVPKRATGAVPAMVIAHGSAGVAERESWWADHLNDIGVAGFIVDSFAPRNIRDMATDKTQLSTAANVADAFGALKLLATCREYAQWFQSKGVDVSVIEYENAYHYFDAIHPPVRARDIVTGRNCNTLFDVDRFALTIRGSGQDITLSTATYERGCQERGAMVGSDSEGRKKSPQDVKM